MPRFLRFGIAALCVLLDQITKIAAERALDLHEAIPVMPMFNIALAYNYGAAFSFLIVWLYRLTMREKWLSLSFALILGGAVGNLIDRALYGRVIDFIQVYYDKYYFPTFNIADSAIFCGTVLLLILTFFEKKPDADAQDE